MSKSKVLMIMTGSIACYKACNLISRLVQNNFEVQVVATPSALQFVGNSTLEGLTGKPVISDMHASGNVMDHIHLMRWADAIVVAPATANFINKAAQGVADDLVQTLFMAHDFKKPFLIAPAMNTSMYQHPLTQKNLQVLKDLGLILLEPNAGTLACGEVGQGKLIEPEDIFQRILIELKKPLSSQTKSLPSAHLAKKVLITAGGTQEPIDKVRVLTNSSSGNTGTNLASQLADLGFDVTLLRAVNSVKAPEHLKTQNFSDFKSLEHGLQELLQSQSFDWVIHAAAVSDYSLDYIEMDGQKIEASAKISSDGEHMSLHLKRNPKLISRLKDYSKNKNITVVGFKLTSDADQDQQLRAVKKILTNADYCVHNDTAEIDEKIGLHTFNFYNSKLEAQKMSSVSDLISTLAPLIQGQQS